jgi:hypothetical protein
MMLCSYLINKIFCVTVDISLQVCRNNKMGSSALYTVMGSSETNRFGFHVSCHILLYLFIEVNQRRFFFFGILKLFFFN